MKTATLRAAHDQTLDRHHRQQADAHADQAKRDPGPDGTRNPSGQVQRRGQADARGRTMNVIEGGGDGGTRPRPRRAAGAWQVLPVNHRLWRCNARNTPQASTATPRPTPNALISDAANEVRGAWRLKIPSPRATKTICAISSVVTSTTVEAKATAVATPWMIAARAPNTIPPSCENGSTSVAASRTMRAHTKTHTLWPESGSNAAPGHPQDQEQRQRIQAENGEATPSDGDGRRKHRADADECNQIERQGGAQSRDENDAQFHAGLKRGFLA